jgi:hypothetical protein
MALILPGGPAFAHASDNFGPLTHDGSTGFGAAVPVGVSNTDGADTAIMPALAHDCEYLYLAVSGMNSSGQAMAALMDLLVDPAGGTSWSNLISDLLVGGSSPFSYNTGPFGAAVIYHFPLWIPAGATLGARIRRQSGSAATARVQVVAMGGNRNPASWWCGQKVESVATFAAASSAGQVHTPGDGYAVTGAANNGSGLIRLTVADTTGLTTGDVRYVSSVGGTTEANGVWTITVVDATHVDLQGSTFTNAWTSGGAIAGNFSSWADLGSPTSARSGAAQWAVGGIVSGTSQLGVTFDFEFGAGGSRIGPRVYRGASSSEQSISLYRGPIFCDIAAGTQLQVRARQSGLLSANQTNQDVAAYLVQ